jgi:hypothetical protein
LALLLTGGQAQAQAQQNLWRPDRSILLGLDCFRARSDFGAGYGLADGAKIYSGLFKFGLFKIVVQNEQLTVTGCMQQEQLRGA